jgi:signal transduction histidine kinase
VKLTPALKLTIWYLAFVMLLSLGFSIFVYRVSVDQINRGLRRPPSVLDLRGYAYFDTYENDRLGRIREAEQGVKANLILFNILVVFVGGGLSYMLAKRNIRPIEEALEAQRRFTADASHELRTPLTAMQSETEVALRDKQLSLQDARHQLSSNLEEVVKMRELVNGLLQLARNGEAPQVRVKVDIARLADEVVGRLAKLAQAKKIKLTTDLKPAHCEGDAKALSELISILVDNAIKYSPAKATIRVATQQRNRQAEIIVEDTGAGIAAVDLPHVFERFYRGDPSRSSANTEGNGLGLSIAKHIADSHQGVISVSSTLGKGSTFRVHLPVKQPRSV